MEQADSQLSAEGVGSIAKSWHLEKGDEYQIKSFLCWILTQASDNSPNLLAISVSQTALDWLLIGRKVGQVMVHDRGQLGRG